MFHIGNGRLSLPRRFSCFHEAVYWRNAIMPKTGMVLPLFQQCECPRCKDACPGCGGHHDVDVMCG